MSDLLLLLGIICIGAALWKGRSQSAGDHKELQEFKQVRDELVDAKKEVRSLLEQLAAVSESVVDSISAKINEARELESATADDNSAAEGFEDAEDDEEDAYEASDTTDAEQVTVPPTAKIKDKSVKREKNKGRTIMFPLVNEGTKEKEASRPARTEPVRELPPKHQMVYAMAKLGYSEAEIAKQMKIGKGEVNLMLELKRKGEEANG